MPQTSSITGQLPDLRREDTDDLCYHDNGLCYRNNNLVSGPLEALIQHLMPSEQYYPDVHRRALVRSRRSLFRSLFRRLAVLAQYEEALGHIQAGAGDSLMSRRVQPQELSTSTSSIWAQQLTHIELERLSFVEPEEFVEVLMSRGAVDSSKRLGQRPGSRSLDAYVDWFNRLSSLVATEICLPEKKKQRAQVVTFFIDVAQECLNIGNFNSLLAVLSGMSMAPVSRLRTTWSRVNKDKLTVLENLMDPTNNFYNYRTALRGATHRSLHAHSNHEKMVVPFFSLLLKDLFFLKEGCTSGLHSGHISFETCWELAKRVSEVLSWSRVECPFEKDRPILSYLLTAPVCSQDALCLVSYEREAPDNSMDKQQWRSLRSTLSPHRSSLSFTGPVCPSQVHSVPVRYWTRLRDKNHKPDQQIYNLTVTQQTPPENSDLLSCHMSVIHRLPLHPRPGQGDRVLSREAHTFFLSLDTSASFS